MNDNSELKNEIDEAFDSHISTKFGGTYEFQMCCENPEEYRQGFGAAYGLKDNLVPLPMDPVKFLRAKAGSDKIIIGHMVNGRAELYIGKEFQYMELLFLKDMFGRRIAMAGDLMFSDPIKPT